MPSPIAMLGADLRLYEGVRYAKFCPPGDAGRPYLEATRVFAAPVCAPAVVEFYARNDSRAFPSNATPCPGRSGAMACPSTILRGSAMYRSSPKPCASR